MMRFINIIFGIFFIGIAMVPDSGSDVMIALDMLLAFLGGGLIGYEVFPHD